MTQKEQNEWHSSNDMIFRSRLLPEVQSIHDEAAALHFRDSALDRFLNGIAENDKISIPSGPEIRWIHIFTAQQIGQRMTELCNQIR
jgi:hypothetical protein